jgi:hypothetical protein
MMFERIGLAITFSPNTFALLCEAKHFKDLFHAELVLIHIGEESEDAKFNLNALIHKCGLGSDEYKLVWKKGDVEDSILEICSEEKIDLLIAGALHRENVLKYYIGSIARTLMREAPCSVLLLTEPMPERKSFSKICVSVDFSSLSETAAKKSCELAKLENLDELCFIREFQMPGLATTIYDSGSKEEAQEQRRKWLDEEKQKMDLFVQELNLKKVKVNTICLYGKQGWEASNWVNENQGDLFVIPSAPRKSKLIDRIFQHDLEFVYKDLPCSLLIIKTTGTD